MTEISYGLRVPSVHPTDVDALRRWVVRAEDLGFHSIWAGDHVFYHVDVLQPLHLLTWVAAQTSRVQLGTAVMLSAYLNPVLLAKASATLDCLSSGRLLLGMSIGGTEAEYRSIGVPMNQRVGRLLESTAILRALWKGENVDYAGKYWQVEKGNILPKPVRPEGIPVYFGANSDAMFRRIARVADGWVGSGSTIPSFLTGVEKVRAFAEEQGRDADSVGFAKLQSISVDENAERARERALSHWGTYYGPRFNMDTAIYGTPEQCAEQLSALANTAAPRVTLALEPSSLELEQLEALASVTVGR